MFQVIDEKIYYVFQALTPEHYLECQAFNFQQFYFWDF